MGRKVTGISFVRGERDDWIPRKSSTPGSESSTTIENSITKVTEAGNRVVKRISFPFKGTGAEAEALRYTERMLVSTNDSRVRLYGLNDFCLIRKYKGHANYRSVSTRLFPGFKLSWNLSFFCSCTTVCRFELEYQSQVIFDKTSIFLVLSALSHLKF